MTAFLTAFGFQLRLAAKGANLLLALATSPLLALVIGAIAEYNHRPDLAGLAVVAPTLMAMWNTALVAAGELISKERSLGTLETLVAAPISLMSVILGRLCAMTLVGSLAFAESWLVAGLVFGRWVQVPHLAAFLLVLVVSAIATACTVAILSPTFVLMPSARIVRNTLNFPFYLLGGVLIPVSYLPEWIRPVSHVIFLSWSADLLRDCLRQEDVRLLLPRLLVIVVLGASFAGVGALLLRRVLRRIRQEGTLSHV